MNQILLLDDDTSILSEVAMVLDSNEIKIYPCQNIDSAIKVLEDMNKHITFAIVDLFLLGARGDVLSNLFVRKYLEPRNIPYGRFTSAPDLVPEECRGEWILDKRDFYSKPEVLLDMVSRSLIASKEKS
jgi:response regulator RpfG family c-di-GMP phosphodiesterase